MATITITDVTDGTIGGDGAFDKLMAAGTAHIEAQFASNRLSSADYSVVYLGMMQAAMTQAVQFVLGEQVADKQAGLLSQKIVTELAQTTDSIGGTTKKQQDLIVKQTDGFDRDAEQKLAKIFSDVYNIHVSALGSNASTPTVFEDPDITRVLEKAASGIGVDLTVV